jgi:solute carrier family 25 2-oxodicarboxylate transporter 21
MYPTDVAKTRQQLSRESFSMLQAMRTIIQQEGAVNLYRGVTSPIFAEAPKRATKFATNEVYKDLLRRDDGSLPWHRAGLAGALAGTTEAFVNCPFETIKVRMQSKEHLHRYRSTADCLAQLLRSEGVAALYRGLEAQIWRNAAWNGTYFASIGTARTWLAGRWAAPAPTKTSTSNSGKSSPSTVTFSSAPSRWATLGLSFVSGLVGGGLGTLLNTPLDVVKSRMQNQLPNASFVYRWTLPSLVHIYRTEGVRALYKGLGPRFLRLGPGGGIMIVVFDTVSQWLR